MRITFAYGLLLASSHWATAHAQPADVGHEDEDAEAAQRYAVEIIVFRYGASVATGSEIFVPEEPPVAASGPVFGDARGLAAEGFATPGDENDPGLVFDDGTLVAERTVPRMTAAAENAEGAPQILEELPTARDVEFAVLPEDERTMGEHYEKLQRLEAYQPVLWSGWTQLVREEPSTPLIDLRRLGRLPLTYQGEFQLYLGRFLHLVVDLALQDVVPIGDDPSPFDAVAEPRAADGRAGVPPSTGTLHHRIVEDRIVNNGDIRYFDHPKYGLLAKVLKIEEDTPIGDTDEGVLLPGGAAEAAPRP